LVKDRTLFGLVKDRSDFLSRLSSAMEPAIRKFTRTGRPAGDASFTNLIERMIGRDPHSDPPQSSSSILARFLQ
jgi:hypothetical protein